MIVVVMLVFLMMTLLAFLVEDQHLLLRRIANQNVAEQGYQLGEGANAWAMRVLHADADRAVDSPLEDWALLGQPIAPTSEQESARFTLQRDNSQDDREQPASLDFGDAEVDIYITDLQGKYNLNNLARREPKARAAQKTIFLNLLETIGIAEFEARELMYASLYDWLDENSEETPNGMESGAYASQPVPYYASDQPLSTLGELYYVNGFTRQIIADLSPFVTVLPEENARININATTPEVLASLSSTPIYDIGTVSAFLGIRGTPQFQGFGQGDISAAENAIIGVSIVGQQPPIAGMLSVSSSYYQINVKVQLDSSFYCMRTKVFRDPSGANSELADATIILEREYDSLCLKHEPPRPISNDSIS